MEGVEVSRILVIQSNPRVPVPPCRRRLSAEERNNLLRGRKHRGPAGTGANLSERRRNPITEDRGGAWKNRGCAAISFRILGIARSDGDRFVDRFCARCVDPDAGAAF